MVFRYGFHLVRSSYWIIPGPSVTKQIFSDLREDYPKQIGEDQVKYVRDLTTGENYILRNIKYFYSFDLKIFVKKFKSYHKKRL